MIQELIQTKKAGNLKISDVETITEDNSVDTRYIDTYTFDVPRFDSFSGKALEPKKIKIRREEVTRELELLENKIIKMQEKANDLRDILDEMIKAH